MQSSGRSMRPVRRAIILGLALALTSCSPASAPSTGGGAQGEAAVAQRLQHWAEGLATKYYYPSSGGMDRTMADRLGDTEGLAPMLNGLRAALGDDRMGPTPDWFRFFLRYNPIWDRNNKVLESEWTPRWQRISAIPHEATLIPWQTALTEINTREMPQIWTLGILADAPSLFNAQGFDPARATVVLQRVQSMPPASITQFVDLLQIERPWAAVLIADNNDLYSNEALDEERFTGVLTAIASATAPPRLPATVPPANN